jgi:hypothetical protein
MNEDISYRTSFKLPTPASQVSSTDEHEFSTLLKVRNDFAADIAALHDFNAFEVKAENPNERAHILLHDVEVNQAVYNILEPLFARLDDTVNDINQKYREKLNG